VFSDPLFVNTMIAARQQGLLEQARPGRRSPGVRRRHGFLPVLLGLAAAFTLGWLAGAVR
jgi:hypothetical protein